MHRMENLKYLYLDTPSRRSRQVSKNVMLNYDFAFISVILCSAPPLPRPAHQHHSFHGRVHSDAHPSINIKPLASESQFTTYHPCYRQILLFRALLEEVRANWVTSQVFWGTRRDYRGNLLIAESSKQLRSVSRASQWNMRVCQGQELVKIEQDSGQNQEFF